MNTATHYYMSGPHGHWAAMTHAGAGMGDAAQVVSTTSGIATPVVLGGLSASAAASAAASGSAALLLGMPLAVAVPVIGAAIAGITIAIVALLRSGCGQACVITSNWANSAEKLLNQNIDAYFALPAPRTDYQKSVALANFDSVWNYLVSQCSVVPGAPGQNCINDRKAGACKWKQTAGSQKYPLEPAVGACWNWFNGYRDPIANDPTVPDTSLGTSTGGGILPTGSDISPLLIFGAIGAAVLVVALS